MRVIGGDIVVITFGILSGAMISLVAIAVLIYREVRAIREGM